MLAEHRVDIERAANILGWIDRPDLDMRALVGGINLLEVGAGRGEHLTARDRVARHAAAEIMDAAGDLFLIARSEERRVGKECVSTCRSRWCPDHYTKKTSFTRLDV